jgi:hypothetical protein
MKQTNPPTPGARIRQLKGLKPGDRVHAVWTHAGTSAELIVGEFDSFRREMYGDVARIFSFVQPGPSHTVTLFDCEIRGGWAELYYPG